MQNSIVGLADKMLYYAERGGVCGRNVAEDAILRVALCRGDWMWFDGRSFTYIPRDLVDKPRCKCGTSEGDCRLGTKTIKVIFEFVYKLCFLIMAALRINGREWEFVYRISFC